MQKAIRLTRHAAERLAERGIDPATARLIAVEPEWTEPEPADPAAERRFGHEGNGGPRIIRVVCVETDAEIRIITATFDRRAGKRR